MLAKARLIAVKYPIFVQKVLGFRRIFTGISQLQANKMYGIIQGPSGSVIKTQEKARQANFLEVLCKKRSHVGKENKGSSGLHHRQRGPCGPLM